MPNLTMPELTWKLIALLALIFAVIGLGYVAFFSENPGSAHTQELNEKIVRSVIKEHAKELIRSAGITAESDDEEWEALPGYLCFWENDVSGRFSTVYPIIYVPKNGISYKYIGQEGIWLATSPVNDLCKYEDQAVLTWTIHDDTGEITYGRPSYDLYDVERPVDAIVNRPPSSEELCKSARNKWAEWAVLHGGEMSENVGFDIRLELFKIQFENACFK